MSSLISNAEMFRVITQWIVNMESITWSRFYNFLTANSLLVVAWAAMHPDQPHLKNSAVLLAISLVGILNSLFWFGLNYRHRRYYRNYLSLGHQYEMKYYIPSLTTTDEPDDFLKGIFQEEKETGQQLRKKWSWASTNKIVLGGPIIFLFLYIVLAMNSN